MEFTITREVLLDVLHIVHSVVERRQSQLILANILLKIEDNILSVTATDQETEIVAWVNLDESQSGTVTVPARKMTDIARLSPENTRLHFSLIKEKMLIRFGRSRYNLSTLPAEDFPTTKIITDKQSVQCQQGDLKRLIHLTQFSMAQDDVRYWLNGLMLEISSEKITTVATDGHRLAKAEYHVESNLSKPCRVIIPKKSINALSRLLKGGDDIVNMEIGSNAIQFNLNGTVLTSKLIDGKFPDYENAIPNADDCDKKINIDRDILRVALTRVSVLSNETLRTIRLELKSEEIGLLDITAENRETEDAQEELEVEYSGEPLLIGFNATYLIDVLSVIPSETVKIMISDANKGCLIVPQDTTECLFVVMPVHI